MFQFSARLLALHFTHARQQSFQTNIASRLASLLSCNFSSVTNIFSSEGGRIASSQLVVHAKVFSLIAADSNAIIAGGGGLAS